MIIDCISDLHGHYPQLEGGDLLIVAGDLTDVQREAAFVDFFSWISKTPYKKRIVIAGNHDTMIEDGTIPMNVISDFEYLCDSGTEFEWFETEDTKWGPRHLEGNRSLKLKIWGSPWTRRFPGMNPKCMAFTVDMDEELAEKWAMIPEDIDILVTHCPPNGVLDEVEDSENVGSDSLIKPMIKSGCRLHVFGHVHESYGKFHNPILGITYVNASHVNEHYEPVNKPVRVEI